MKCELRYQNNITIALLALIIIALPGMKSFAYQTTSNDKKPIDWTARGLSEREVELQSVGLAIHLPIESTYTLKPQSSRRLQIDAKDKSWIAAIDIQRTADDTVTVAQVADATIKTNQQKAIYTSVPKRASLTINGQKAERLIIKLRPQQGQEEVNAMYTIFKPLPKTFVIYKVWTKVSRAEAVFDLHRMVVDSISFTDPANLAQKRNNEISLTIMALDKLDRSAYERMIVPEQWYRVFNKDKEGNEHEIAYYRIREEIGMLGAVNHPQDTQAYDTTEREEGLLTSLLSRYLLKTDGSAYADIITSSWMSLDRTRERWSIRSAQYVKNDKTGAFQLVNKSTVTGDRRGDITQVVLDFPPSPTDTVQIHTPKKAYVNQAEQALIYRILQPWQKTVYGMYLYEPQVQKLTYRTETIEPGHPTVSMSRRMKDAKLNTVTLNDDGTIARIVMANGNITVPIDPQKLLQLWKSQKLPTGRGKTSNSQKNSNADLKSNSGNKSNGKRR